MIIQRLIALFVLLIIIIIDASPIHQNIRQYEHRQRRSLQFMNWPFVDTLYKRLYDHHSRSVAEDRMKKRSEIPSELRPVKGPMNIEQLPAMLAARYVKRYPYSQQDDPATIGR